MATIKDIAKRAGVSHGTVSNVLNKNGNVSVEKIRRVEQAAKELGFVMNVQAKQLRKGSARKVGLILPSLMLHKYNEIYKGIEFEIAKTEFEFDVYFSNGNREIELNIIEKIASSGASCVIAYSVLKRLEEYEALDIPVMILNRDLTSTHPLVHSISFDYRALGNALARQVIQDNRRNIVVVTGQSKVMYREFLEGVSDVLEDEDVAMTHKRLDDLLLMKGTLDILSQHHLYDAIIAMDEDVVENAMKLTRFTNHATMPNIYTVGATGLLDPQAAYRMDVNYQQLGKKAAEIVTQLDFEAPVSHLILADDGFKYETVTKPDELEEINVLMLKSPTTNAIRAIVADFTTQHSIRVNIVELTYDELLKTVSLPDSVKNYDLIRIDMGWMTRVGAQIFKKLDNLKIDTLQARVPRYIPDDYTHIDGIMYTVPLDASVQVLYYRKDLFEDAIIKRSFYEMHKRNLTVPTTYEEYDEISEFFTREFNNKSKTHYGTSLVYGSNIVTASDFIPRVRDYSQKKQVDIKMYDLKHPVMRGAIEAYVQSKKYSDRDTNHWWSDVLNNLTSGSTAMGTVYSNHASSLIESEEGIHRIGYADIPGGQPMLGGGVIGITKTTSHEAAGIKFLEWLYSPEISALITYLGGSILTNKVHENVDVLRIYPWIEKYPEYFAKGKRREESLIDIGIDEFSYEMILGEAIRSYILGVSTLDDALERAIETLNKRR
ncbi:extracellular solute-binding protein [Erysipelothrix aquatica]|uniref:extracellular solute-binding protein n=1 Tax=Erysipelothrix aquatica TaxID=2683714 RepID=UPI00135BA51B|nr:extracellular solute-binding protein [Erysipelothrix aquatica]